MLNWTSFIYISLIGASLLLGLLGFWFTSIIPGIDRWSKKFFTDYFIVFTLAGIAVLFEAALEIEPVSVEALLLVLIIECFLLALPLPMITVYLLHCCGEDLKSSRLLRTVMGFLIIYNVVLFSTPFIPGFIIIDESLHYSRGHLYPIIVLPLVSIMVLNLVYTLRHRDKLSRKVFTGFLTAIVPLTVTLTIQLFVDVYLLMDISIILSALTMYGFALSDQIEQDLRHQREIANQKASIMVLQMRPHYIYNTLMSIYSLCNIDPQKARQVTMDFTNYLRKNFNAIASDSTIPFTAELEHTRAYLSVEQAQFEDMLVVEYDTPFTHFRLPPLTLQPIVENAVKHGMDPYAGPLHVCIRTRHTDAGTEIFVEDSGTGFVEDLEAEAAVSSHTPEPNLSGKSPVTSHTPGPDPAGKKTSVTTHTPGPDPAGAHLALTNIRQRLEMMCGGTLTISPRDGGGTVVKVTIPQNQNS